MRFRHKRYREIDRQIKKFRADFSEEVYANCKGNVQNGPLKGFFLLDDFSWGGMVDVTAKIFGYYEHQNLAVFTATEKKTLIDIGAADGFWGVGLVFAGFFENSICFETRGHGRRVIRRTARANGILDKVQVRGMFDEESQNEFVENTTDPADLFFLIDIEGAEFDMLSHDFLSRFRSSEFLIELHTQGVESGSEKLDQLIKHASEFFDYELITDGVRDASVLDGISGLPDNIRRALLSEGRRYAMQWLHLIPFGGSKARFSG